MLNRITSAIAAPSSEPMVVEMMDSSIVSIPFRLMARLIIAHYLLGNALNKLSNPSFRSTATR